MKFALLCFLGATLFFLEPEPIAAQVVSSVKNAGSLCFLENKGQIADQFGNERNDIQFAMGAPGMNVFIGSGAVHYEFVRTICSGFDPKSQKAREGEDEGARKLRVMAAQSHATIESYRVDVTLEGADLSAPVVTDAKQLYTENYSHAGCNGEQVSAAAFRQVTFKNVYPGIDWVFKTDGRVLEHEFVLQPGADASQIKLDYSGQINITIDPTGSLVISTPMGIIKEKTPVCYAVTPMGNLETHGGFSLHGNALDYDIADYNGGRIIDPYVEWGTYYGWDSSTSPVYAMAYDKAGYMYICGLTYSPTLIATSGSYQNTYEGNADGYVAKFDTAGHRYWGTYFGGTEGDWSTGVTLDTMGNIYVTGATASATMVATAGAFQPTYGGGLWDAYLARFSPAGALVWASYYGGPGADIPYSAEADKYGNVYIAGFTSSSSGMSTSGGFQPVSGGGYDCFIAQFNTSAGFNWASFFGGPGAEYNATCALNGFDVYLTGWTSSTTGIATLGAYQPTFGGGSGDAFVLKIDSSGARYWSSYYGGEAAETMGGITISPGGYIYILGSTGSLTGIATPGCFQPEYGGGSVDAFLEKLDPEAGYKLWGTYYGGENTEDVDLSRIVADDSDNVLITGYTLSETGIASPGAWQPIYGGGDDDAFFAKFSRTGTEEWSTYYGGTNTDGGQAAGFDGKNVYIAGKTSSPNNIATVGALQTVGGGGPYYWQGFFTKFIDTDTSVSPLSAAQIKPLVSSFNVYPSPNNGNFTIAGIAPYLSGNYEVGIINDEGTRVWNGSASVTNGTFYLPVQLPVGLPAGVYTIRIVAAGEVVIQRFVKD